MLTFKNKNREFVDLFNGLQLVKDLEGVEFGLAVAKNITILKQKLSALEDIAKPSEEFVLLSRQATQLKDDVEAIAKLEADNAESIERRKIHVAEIEELLDIEVDVELHTVRESILPQNTTATQIEAINLIIDGDI
tara:strand:+ start:146 stop:553 length:408 start_codon:yes stop_codon:yes gene_type:complete